MTRRFEADCAGYDRLLASITAPEGARVRLVADTDRGIRTSETTAKGPVKREYVLELRGAKRLRRITLELMAGGKGPANGNLNWIGLQNAKLLDRHLAQWRAIDPRWPGYLEPPTRKPSFEPKVGLLMDAREWDRFRARHAAHLRRYGSSPFTESARRGAKAPPERCVGENIKCYAERLFCREREHELNLLGEDLLGYGGHAAVLGMLTRDPKWSRLAARYALTMAWCGHWDDFVCFVPGGTFDQRCFTAASCTFQTALILDLAWDCFTPLGRELIMQKMVRLGLAEITFNTWRYEYIFNCNQMAWFSFARMAGALFLERFWPRVRAEAEQARRDLDENIGQIVLSDGGFVEGPTYFTTVGRHGGMTWFMYALARKKSFGAVVPAALRRTAAFAAAIAATDDATDVIPFCDSRSLLDHDTLGVMATLLPRSQWVAMFRKSLVRSRGMPREVMAMSLERHIPRRAPPPPAIVRLPVMGVVASTRRYRGEWVKLFLMGNKAGAGHTHEDKGHFVLEFAGDTLACDPGTTDYSSPFAIALKHCQFHNMLIPFGTRERAHPASPLPVDIRPVARGTKTRFEAEMNLASGWESYYRAWRRRWMSPSPDRLIIRDTYALREGEGVEFFWQTRLPVTVSGCTFTVRGRRGEAVVTVSEGCTVELERITLPGEFPLEGGPVKQMKHHRVRIRRRGRNGAIEAAIRLFVR
jgi:hypothetical protein